MQKINLGLDLTKKYVIACSFGPDSMALLNLAYNLGVKIVVAHVNYHKRDVSNDEQRSLQKYCDERNIKLYVLDLLGKNHTGNFQNWAREMRYKFFKEVCEKEGAYAVLVAHQQDDVIETYLMQKNRGNFVKNAGISGEIELFGVKIIRPLLNYSKSDLECYDKENNVPYSIDESNLKSEYTRNKIRHEIVEKMTVEERLKILKQIQTEKHVIRRVSNKYKKDEFLSLSDTEIIQIIDHFMKKLGEHRDISFALVSEIKKAIIAKINWVFEITPSLLLECDYGEVVFVNKRHLQEYRHEFIIKFNNELFTIDFSLGAEDRGIANSNEKLIVKNIDKEEVIQIGGYNKKAKRVFIDWKVPLYLREVWPGIYNESGKLLYVPRYRKNFVDNHKSTFKINTDFFTEF